MSTQIGSGFIPTQADAEFIVCACMYVVFIIHVSINSA